jgi:tRNA isopentenyl-2-thiomethyl-A-37 hydroxylase MiaE
MFMLAEDDVKLLVSQNVIPSKKHLGGALPLAFTEQGVAMLSSILNSKTAIEVNIAIMRAFVFMRRYALSHRDLTEKLAELEKKYDQKFHSVHQALEYLLQKDRQLLEQPKRNPIGFHAGRQDKKTGEGE